MKQEIVLTVFNNDIFGEIDVSWGVMGTQSLITSTTVCGNDWKREFELHFLEPHASHDVQNPDPVQSPK